MRDDFYIAACLIWYDESPEDLFRMAESLKGFADGLVALDGAFQDFPMAQEAKPWSPPEQCKALAEGSVAAELELILHQPTKPGQWPMGFTGNEVEKRNASIRVAGAAWEPDWVFNIDADMYLYEHGDARNLLRKTKYDVAQTDIEGTLSRHHLFRWSPTLKFWKAHWCVRDGKRLFAGNEQMRVSGEFPNGLEPCIELEDVLKFDHPAKSDFWRRARQNQWYEIRDSRGIEAL